MSNSIKPIFSLNNKDPIFNLNYNFKKKWDLNDMLNNYNNVNLLKTKESNKSELKEYPDSIFNLMYCSCIPLEEEDQSVSNDDQLIDEDSDEKIEENMEQNDYDENKRNNQSNDMPMTTMLKDKIPSYIEFKNNDLLDGLSYEDAINILEELNLIPTVVGDTNGKVRKQIPRKGEFVEPGKVVELTFGD